MENKTYKKPYRKQSREKSFAAMVREMKVGDVIELGGEYLARQSAYVGATQAFPTAKFSCRVVNSQRATLTRIS